MKNFRKMCRGEKGFTLIELLVVIIILGVLAAVVTLAVTRFIGKGTLESANAEAVTVQAAVEAAMGEAGSAILGGSQLGAWSGSDAAGVLYAGALADNVTVGSMMRTHLLKATYTFNTNGDITGAVPTVTGGTGWGATIHWDTTEVKWHKGAS
jgi:prepilin-type N-terminal cleavage/methylation domain-containing protein